MFETTVLRVVFGRKRD